MYKDWQNYIKEETKKDFITTYGKLPTDKQYIELLGVLVGDEGVIVSSSYDVIDGKSYKRFHMELKDFWSYDYDEYEDAEVEYNFSVAGSFEECVLSAINIIDAEFGSDHDYMSVRAEVERILK